MSDARKRVTHSKRNASGASRAIWGPKPMLIRSCTAYRPCFRFDRHGFLLVTRRWIWATGSYARAWS